MKTPRLRADFNGLFGDVLCLSHGDTCPDETGAPFTLREGIVATVFEEDTDEHGNRDDLIATGVVERAPDWLKEHGSRWVLKIDQNGVRNQSEL